MRNNYIFSYNLYETDFKLISANTSKYEIQDNKKLNERFKGLEYFAPNLKNLTISAVYQSNNKISGIKHTIGSYTTSFNLFNRVITLKMMNWRVTNKDLILLKAYSKNNSKTLKEFYSLYTPGTNAENWLSGKYSHNASEAIIYFLPANTTLSFGQSSIVFNPETCVQSNSEFWVMFNTILKEKKLGSILKCVNIFNVCNTAKSGSTSLLKERKAVWTQAVRTPKKKDFIKFLTYSSWNHFLAEVYKKEYKL